MAVTDCQSQTRSRPWSTCRRDSHGMDRKLDLVSRMSRCRPATTRPNRSKAQRRFGIGRPIDPGDTDEVRRPEPTALRPVGRMRATGPASAGFGRSQARWTGHAPLAVARILDVVIDRVVRDEPEIVQVDHRAGPTSCPGRRRLRRQRRRPRGRGRRRGCGREVVIQLVDERDAGRDVELGDVRVADAVEVLDERAQRVAVRRHQHGLARCEVFRDVGLPVGQQAIDHELERLGARDLAVDVRVALVVHLAVLGVIRERRAAERRTSDATPGTSPGRTSRACPPCRGPAARRSDAR